MKKIFLFSLLMLASGIPQFASAGKIIGNGGMVLLCQNQVPKVRLLDLWEAPGIYYQYPNMPALTMSEPDGRTYQEKFQSLVARISERFPDLAQKILAEYAVLNKGKLFVERTDLGPTKDDYNVMKPEGCTIEQAAVQNEPMFPRSRTLVIKSEYWKEMDDTNKAGLLLHEALYRIGIKNGLEHSVGIRYLVGLLFANEIDQIGDNDWISAFTQSRIRNFEVATLKIPLFTGEFAPCRPLPGRESCEQTEAFKQANFRFTADNRLQEVSYGPAEENVSFMTYSALAVNMRVKDMRFDWSRGSVELQSSGQMSLRGRDKQVTMRFDGRISVADGNFDGTQTVTDAAKREIMNRAFNGTLAEIVSDFGYPTNMSLFAADSISTVDNSRTASAPFDDRLPETGTGSPR